MFKFDEPRPQKSIQTNRSIGVVSPRMRTQDTKKPAWVISAIFLRLVLCPFEPSSDLTENGANSPEAAFGIEPKISALGGGGGGGKAATIVYSLIETCKLKGIDP